MSDEALFAMYLNGSKDAFNELITRYIVNVTNYICSIVKNKYLADDIFQDCVMYILQHPETYKPEYKFQSYIFLIARKRSLSRIVRDRRREEIIEENFCVYDEITNKTDLSDLMLAKENKKELLKALDSLKPEYSEIIYYIDILKMQHKEVETLLNKENTRVLVYRARKKLREVIEKDYPDLAKMYTPATTPAKKIMQIFIACSLATSVTAGIAFATLRFYESIWKKPEYFTLSDALHESEGYFGIIDVSKAREKIDGYLKILGETDYDLTNVEFHNDIALKNELFRLEKPGDFDIRISARTGELKSYYTMTPDLKNYENAENSNVENAINMCNDMYQKLGISSEYELYSCEKYDYGVMNDCYQISYCTKYDGVFNAYENITFILNYANSEIVNIITTNYDFEDNEIAITKPEAEKIFHDVYPDEKIENIEIDIIEQNNDANYVNQYEYGEMVELDQNKTYTVESKDARRVWRIYYKESEKTTVLFYIDCTTGEVVGEEYSKFRIIN